MLVTSHCPETGPCADHLRRHASRQASLVQSRLAQARYCIYVSLRRFALRAEGFQSGQKILRSDTTRAKVSVPSLPPFLQNTAQTLKVTKSWGSEHSGCSSADWYLMKSKAVLMEGKRLCWRRKQAMFATRNCADAPNELRKQTAFQMRCHHRAVTSRHLG